MTRSTAPPPSEAGSSMRRMPASSIAAMISGAIRRSLFIARPGGFRSWAPVHAPPRSNRAFTSLSVGRLAEMLIHGANYRAVKPPAMTGRLGCDRSGSHWWRSPPRSAWCWRAMRALPRMRFPPGRCGSWCPTPPAAVPTSWDASSPISSAANGAETVLVENIGGAAGNIGASDVFSRGPRRPR